MSPEGTKACAEPVQKLHDLFFAKDSIVDTFTILVTEEVNKYEDSITDVMLSLIKNTFMPCLTDVGVLPFGNLPMLIIPYKNMSKAQLKILQEVCDQLSNNAKFTSCNQIGGGVCLSLTVSREQQFQIDPALILYASGVFAFRNLMSDSKQKEKTRSNIFFNIILQRVLSSVNVPRERIAVSKDWLREHMDAQK